MIKLKPYQQALILTFAFALLIITLMITTRAMQPNDYSTLQQLKHLKDTGGLMVHDGSFGGHTIYSIPFFVVITYIFSLIFPLIVVKAIMLLAFSASIYLVYIISFKITESPFASLFSTMFAGMSTAYISTSAGFGAYLLAIPLTLLLAYLIITKNYNINWIMLVFIPLTLLNLSSLYFLIAMLVSYFIYINYGKRPKNVISELMIIFASAIMIVIMIFYYNALRLNGISIFYNNIPSEILSGMLGATAIVSSALSVGLLLLLLAIGGVFIAYFNKLSRSYIIISLFAVSLAASLFGGGQFIPILLTFTGAILSAHSINYLFQFISLSKLSKHRELIAAAFVIIAAASLLPFSIPSIYAASYAPPSQGLQDAYGYLSQNMKGGELFLANLSIAGQAEYYTGKDAFIDNDFSGIRNSELYYHDYKLLFDTRSTVEALRISSNNNVRYILIGPNDKIPFYLTKGVVDSECFTEKDFKDAKVYQILCGVS